MTKIEKMQDELLAKICESCHWPYACRKDELADHCDECEIAGDLGELIKAARTDGAVQTITIVAEEMKAGPKG